VDIAVDSLCFGRLKYLVDDALHLWTQCSAALQGRIPDTAWRAWFEAVEPLEIQSDALHLAVPNPLARERIETRYLNLLEEALAAASPDRRLGVNLVVRTGPGTDPGPSPPAATSGEPSPTRDHRAGPPAHPSATLPYSLPAGEAGGRRRSNGDDITLNPQYTFDAFVIGPSNRFAHAAAQAVAETPARSYNPLFVYGDAGLGKTHLLHAIGHYVRENYPDRLVRYVSTETFLNDFVDAIRTSATAAFKQRYRLCDVLLVDDVQFIENKERFQEEFFHTFNSLYGASKQIVITSDRPPRSIATLEDRLRSRFMSGLITDITPPELETRLAILRKKAETEASEIPDEVLEFIATHVRDNIRELEGALIRVTAFASLNHQPLTKVLVEDVLADLLEANQPRRITPGAILEATASTFGFTVQELCGTSRRRPLVTARQIGMYVFRELTDFSYPAIAREFGGRDHTTVIHAVDKIAGLMKERRQIYDQVTDLILHIKGNR
jgi:chromosomal replication initiator protein